MKPDEIDRVIAYGLLAFIACGVCWFCGLAVSALMLGGLGAMSGSFGNWRTEGGLWMLAALFLLIFGGFFAMFIYHQILDWWVGRLPLRGAMAIDWLIGISTLSYMVRFLWAVTYWNKRVSSDA